MAYLACAPKINWRPRQEVMVKTRVSPEKLITEVSFKDIFVDGRKDPILIVIEDSSTKKFCRRIENQENISVTSEPDSEPKGPNKPVKEAAIGLYNWMVPKGIDQTIVMIGSDSTNSMNGSMVTMPDY